MTLGAFCVIPSGEMDIKFTLSHRTRLPASVITTSLPLYFIADLQLVLKETTYWPKYTIKCVGFSIRLPYTTETINLAKPLGNHKQFKPHDRCLRATDCTQTTPRLHPDNTQATPRLHPDYTQTTPRLYPDYTQTTPRLNVGYIQTTPRLHSD